MPRTVRYWMEVLVLYLAVPLLLYFRVFPFSLMLLLTLLGVFFGWILWSDPGFESKRLWAWPNWRSEILSILLGFVPMAAVMTLATWWLMPEHLFRLPQQRPLLMLVIAIFYPLFSVIPQAIIYRAWFFHRYWILFPWRWGLVTLNALLFMFGHILFRNELALALTFGGGWLFAYRYLQTNSLLATIFEHALYGVWLFACGLGVVLVMPA